MGDKLTAQSSHKARAEIEITFPFSENTARLITAMVFCLLNHSVAVVCATCHCFAIKSHTCVVFARLNDPKRDATEQGVG